MQIPSFFDGSTPNRLLPLVDRGARAFINREADSRLNTNRYIDKITEQEETRTWRKNQGLGEQALNKVAEVGLASQLDEVKNLDVDIVQADAGTGGFSHH